MIYNVGEEYKSTIKKIISMYLFLWSVCCETIIGTVVFTNATQTPGNKRSRRKYGGAHETASVLDSTFMNQFSRKLREIETHSDYGNIEIVVR